MRKKMKIGDRVVMVKGVWPNIKKFRSGTIRDVDGWNISVKRDGYKGHEYTWWDEKDWKAVK